MAHTGKQDEERVTVDQLTQARALCGDNPLLQTELEDFLNTRPSRAQMYAFIENMRDPARRKAELERRIARICDFVGIAEPTGTEKLLALHIGLLQEQNQALDRLTNRTAQVAAQTGQHPPVLGPVLAALLIDRVL